MAVLMLLSAIGIFLALRQHDGLPAQEVTIDELEKDRSASDQALRDPADFAAVGAQDAPVVIVGYTDYQCAYCASFDAETLPELMEKYIDQGLVRFEARDFPALGEASFNAAVASRAAGNQNMFWDYRAALFDATLKRESLSPERLMAIAVEIGVPDIELFEADLEECRESVSQAAEEARTLSLSAVPYYFINQRQLQGGQSSEVFVRVVEDELATLRDLDR
ncbi:DsbA family protein [Microbacterium foliorum]|uniref:DsbA family protein n=1 Tax=Microbacterium foliorum TaxID=104336 RepID=UPI001E36652B|nr:thioredoxin domain-containing protein [Microbacterium foliorum]